MDSEELLSTLSESVTKPQSASNDAGSVAMHSLYNQLLLLKHLKNQEAQDAGTNVPKFKQLKMGDTRVI